MDFDTIISEDTEFPHYHHDFMNPINSNSYPMILVPQYNYKDAYDLNY